VERAVRSAARALGVDGEINRDIYVEMEERRRAGYTDESEHFVCFDGICSEFRYVYQPTNGDFGQARVFATHYDGTHTVRVRDNCAVNIHLGDHRDGSVLACDGLFLAHRLPDDVVEVSSYGFAESRVASYRMADPLRALDCSDVTFVHDVPVQGKSVFYYAPEDRLIVQHEYEALLPTAPDQPCVRRRRLQAGEVVSEEFFTLLEKAPHRLHSAESRIPLGIPVFDQRLDTLEDLTAKARSMSSQYKWEGSLPTLKRLKRLTSKRDWVIVRQ